MNEGAAILSDLITEMMGELIYKYDLTLVPYDKEEAYLVGSNFGLRFVAEWEGVDLTYIAQNGKGGWSEYYPRVLLENRFKPQDRLAYGQPQCRAAIRAASLRVHASAITREFDDVLRGDQKWLNKERAYIRDLDRARCLAISNAMLGRS